MKGHATVYRVTGGHVGHRFPFAPPTLLLDHVGAKSGTKRTTPLTYLADGDDLVLVASKGGNPRHPAWFHNLRAHPDVTVQVGSRRRPVRARVATPDGADAPVAEGRRHVRRLCRLSAPDEARDPADHPGAA